MSVLITGANGRTSRQVIHRLLSSPECPPLRPLVHSQSSQEQLGTTFPQLRASPHKIVIADYLTETTILTAMTGVSVVFHNGPAFHPSEATMGIAVINAAMEAGNNPHIIYCSILHPMRAKLLHHTVKLKVEEYLIESKLHYTILQPTHYMQNVPLSSVCQTGILPLGYSMSTTQGFVDLVDLADVVRAVIFSPLTHTFATYELVGQNMPYSSVADIIQEESGKPVKCVVLSVKEFVEKTRLVGATASEYSQHAAERMMLYCDRWGLTGSPNILKWLLGRDPTTWQQYIRRELAI
ncbi:NAD(P)-binding protein [Ramaria rubella]|nr:NAD(P)-binding protein [Ramaria rubella]